MCKCNSTALAEVLAPTGSEPCLRDDPRFQPRIQTGFELLLPGMQTLERKEISEASHAWPVVSPNST